MANSPAEHPRDVDRLIYAGLLGLAATAIIQLVGSREEHSPALVVAIYAFSAAIPLLTAGLVTDYARRGGREVPPWRDAMGLFAILLAVVGLGALFFHFGNGPGAVFVGCGVLSVALIRKL